MDIFRIVLILLGVAVIIGLVAHGLWTLRVNQQQGDGARGKQQGSHKRQRGMQADLLAEVDSSRVAGDESAENFDDLGLSKVRLKKKSVTSAPEQVTDEANASDEAVRAKNSDDEPEIPSLRADRAAEPVDNAQETSGDAIRAEKNGAASVSVPLDTKGAAQDAEQLAIGLPEDYLEDAPEEPPQDEVITLYVSGDIQGPLLLETVTELGLKFGDMDIFHRYEQPSGRGPLLFRMANMYNPGTFDLDDIESFRTRGVVLFMALPIKYDGHKAFTMMYNAANKIADAMPRAAVLDHNRNPMTKQSVQHTYQRIREFERKARLAGLRASH